MRKVSLDIDKLTRVLEDPGIGEKLETASQHPRLQKYQSALADAALMIELAPMLLRIYDKITVKSDDEDSNPLHL